VSHIEDRWYRRVGGRLVATARKDHGKRWRARWTDPDGRERSKSFDRKTDADKFLTNVGADILRGHYIDPDAGKITLRRYVTTIWLPSRTFDATTREAVSHRLDKHILPALGDKRLDQLARTPSVVSAWLGGLQVAPQYARVILTVLSSVLDSAQADGLIVRNPCRASSVRPPRAVRRKLEPWTADMVDGMRAAIRAGEWLPAGRRKLGRYAALIDAAAGLGLRQGECFALAVPAVNFLARRVEVRLQVRVVGGRPVFAEPKGKRERTVPLPRPVAEALAEHIRLYPPREVTLPWRTPDGKPRTELLIFTSSRGGVIARTQFNKAVWLPARTAAGIASVRANGMHALRHRYASVLLAGGVDIRALSDYLGHHDPGFTLRIYAHLLPSAEGKALRAIEDAMTAESDGPGAAHAGEGTI